MGGTPDSVWLGARALRIRPRAPRVTDHLTPPLLPFHQPLSLAPPPLPSPFRSSFSSRSLVETARAVAEAEGASEGLFPADGAGDASSSSSPTVIALKPHHYREAYQRLRAGRCRDGENAGQLGCFTAAAASGGASRGRRILYGSAHAGPSDGALF